MRLIDADALLERIENPYQYIEVAVWVNDMPTIERKKGKWKRIDHGNGLYYYYCPYCRFMPRNNVLSNYCPNCGVDLRGKKGK